MSKKVLRQAILALSRYHGQSKYSMTKAILADAKSNPSQGAYGDITSDLEGWKTEVDNGFGGKQFEPVVKLNAANSLSKNFLEPSLSIPTVGAFGKGLADIAGSGAEDQLFGAFAEVQALSKVAGLVFTWPNDSLKTEHGQDFTTFGGDTKGLGPLNASGRSFQVVGSTGGKAKLGTPFVDQDLTVASDEDLKASFPPMYIIQCFRPNNDPAVGSSDVVQTLLNSIPTIELSRAVPYLKVEILANKTQKDSNTILGFSTSRFVMGETKDNANKAFIEAPFLADVVSTGIEEFDRMSVRASMDVFTTPQTLRPDKNPSKRSDPFRPFMSIESFSVKATAPKVGLSEAGCEVFGDLDIVLHDKTRMKDIAALVQPGGFQDGHGLKITYGYSHPDSVLMSRPSDANKQKNLYGILLDSMKVTEVFDVTGVDFSIEPNGEVKIKIALMSLGAGSNLRSLDITDAYSTSVPFSEVVKQLTSIRSLINRLNKKPLEKVTIPSILTSQGELGGKNISRKQYNQIVAFRKQILSKTSKSSRDQKDIVKEISELLNTTFLLKDSALKIASKSRSGYLTSLLTALNPNKRQSIEPFAAARPAGMKKISGKWVGWGYSALLKTSTEAPSAGPTYVTLGKLLSIVVGTPLRKAYAGRVHEIQMIFHGFNEDAGAVQDFNIAQFPIEYKAFKNLLTKEFNKTSSMSLASFINFLNREYISNEASSAYGIMGLPSGTNREEALNLIYGLDKSYPNPRFVLPQLAYTTRILPGRSTLDEKSIETGTALPILRIEFFDQAAGIAREANRLIDAVSTGGVYFPLKRYTTATREVGLSQYVGTGMMHEYWARLRSANYTQFFTSISNNPEIEKVKKKIAADSPLKETLDAILKDSQVIDLSEQSIRQIIQTTTPTIRHGTAASGVLSAKVSSTKVANEVELAIARRNLSGNALSKEEGDQPDEFITSVFPIDCSMETIGCPYFGFSQKYYLDFGTGTDVDNVYTVTNIDHVLRAGEFKTSVEFVQTTAFPQYVSLTTTVNQLVADIAASTK